MPTPPFSPTRSDRSREALVSTKQQPQSSKLIFGFFLLCFFASACSSVRSPHHAAARPIPANTSELSVEERARAHAHYATAVVHDLNGKPDAALEEYLQAARIDARNESLIMEVSRRLLNSRRAETAVSLLSKATESPDASGALYARLGLAYYQVGKTNQAIDANRTAIRKSPQSISGYQHLFVGYLQAAQPDKAAAVLDEAFQRSESSPEFLVSLADLYVNLAIQVPARRKEANDRALATLRRASALKPKRTALNLKIAESLAALGDAAAAANVWHELLKSSPEIGPLREQVHARLAEYYLRSSDHQRATEQLEGLIKEDPTNAQAYYFLGALAAEKNNHEAAAGYLTKALIMAPDFERAYYDLASAQIALNKPAEAMATLQKARAKFASNFMLELLSGVAATQQKDYTNALAFYTTAEVIAKATEPARLNHAFFFQLGATLERKGDRQQAESYFRRALEAKPDFPEAQNYLGYMWAEQGTNLLEARELIEKAVQAQPTNAAYLDSLAWVLFKQGETKEALKLLLKAVDLLEEPDATVYDHLGDIYEALGNHELAREAWKKSLSLEASEVIRKKLGSAAPP